MPIRYWSWIVFPAIVLVAWQIGAARVDALVMPSPAATLDALAQLARDGDLWRELAVSLRRVGLGVLIGLSIGLPFGVLLGSSRAVELMFGASLPAIAATSSAIWAVFGLLWFGLSDSATVFVVVMTALPLISVNARDGIKAVDPDLVQLARSMGFGPAAVGIKILLPSILPVLFAGVRLGLGFGWRVGLVAEALGSPSGVGFRLKQAIDLLHTAEVFAWSLAVIGVMIAIELVIFYPLETCMFRWRKPSISQGRAVAT